MTHAEALAQSLGIDALSLEVFSENKTALDFYQSLGYRKIAELPVIPHECHPYRDKIYLVRKQL
jgi:ribosomal protein S18 acetylase RimI-like enzyme